MMTQPSERIDYCREEKDDPIGVCEHRYRYLKVASLTGESDSILDIGCGFGYGMSILNEKKNKGFVIGIDIDKSAVLTCKSNFPSSTVFIAPADALPFQNNAFDIVTCFDVIEHLKHHKVMLDEIYRVLKPQGILYISTPNKIVWNLARRLNIQPGNPFHLHEYTLNEFKDVLKKSGFKIINVEGVMLPIPLTRLLSICKNKIIANFFAKVSRHASKNFPFLASNILITAKRLI